MSYPTFPELSRQPALKTKTQLAVDPTLRDDMSNGMETTRAKFTRFRRQYSVSIENLTADDITALDEFVDKVAVAGANIFIMEDDRDPKNPKSLMVRFSVVPKHEEAGWVEDQLRQNTTFEIREV